MKKLTLFLALGLILGMIAPKTDAALLYPSETRIGVALLGAAVGLGIEASGRDNNRWRANDVYHYIRGHYIHNDGVRYTKAPESSDCLLYEYLMDQACPTYVSSITAAVTGALVASAICFPKETLGTAVTLSKEACTAVSSFLNS